ncbi:MAG: aldehyde dehydrogenase family protein [Phycisphaerales bacterium]
MSRTVPAIKTCKLFIDGAFVRSESGRTMPVDAGDTTLHVARASRKDLRDAVEAARKAQPDWQQRTGYSRGQILYRLAEMLEARSSELIESVRASHASRMDVRAARREVAAAIDRVVGFAGWCDKLHHVLGCGNNVAGPYYNFSVPEPSGAAVLLTPADPALLALLTVLATSLCAGAACSVIAAESAPLPAVIVSEACATADVPRGVVNILTAMHSELLDHVASHREVACVIAVGVSPSERALLERGRAENLKRVHVLDRDRDAWFDDQHCESPEEIARFMEIKTIWHPSAM